MNYPLALLVSNNPQLKKNHKFKKKKPLHTLVSRISPRVIKVKKFKVKGLQVVWNEIKYYHKEHVEDSEEPQNFLKLN